jgi:transcription antitermination factor NusG
MPAFWGVVRSQPQRERFAAEQLDLRGYETFLPMVETKRSKSPLFACYFFVLIVEQWRIINSCFGVLGLVRTGDCPSRMPDHEIERLKAMTDAHGLIRLPNKPSGSARRVFAKGEAVKIIGGPLQGVSALHSGMHAADREVLLLSLLGAQRQVKVPSHLVEAQ